MRRCLQTLWAARFIAAISSVALLWAAEGLAHHSTSYFSKDLKDVVRIHGKVVRYEFRSPHSLVFVETKDETGALVVWRFESTPAAWLIREGWLKDSLKVGDMVTVEGFPIPGQHYAWIGKVTKDDGTRLLPQRSSATPPDWNP